MELLVANPAPIYAPQDPNANRICVITILASTSDMCCLVKKKRLCRHSKILSRGQVESRQRKFEKCANVRGQKSSIFKHFKRSSNRTKSLLRQNIDYFKQSTLHCYFKLMVVKSRFSHGKHLRNFRQLLLLREKHNCRECSSYLHSSMIRKMPGVSDKFLELGQFASTYM